MKILALAATVAFTMTGTSVLAQSQPATGAEHDHPHGAAAAPAATPPAPPPATPVSPAPPAGQGMQGMPGMGAMKGMSGMGSMQRDMSAMMADMGAMMNRTNDPSMKARMQKMHDQMAGMMANMQNMGGMMGGTMMQPTAANPFPPAEMHMHMTMMHAIGADADETYVRKMIEHHRGAIEMSRLVLASSKDARVLQLANQDIAAQTRDIADLQAWLSQHGKSEQ